MTVLPWELVQTRSVENTNARNATIAVKALDKGHLVVVAAQIDNRGLVTSVTDTSGCNDYVGISPSLSTSSAMDVNLQLWYAKNSCAGATAISVAGTGTVSALAVWDVAGIRTDDPLDTAAALNDQPSSATPLAPTLTTSAAGDFVVAVVMAENMITDVRAGNEFVNDHTTKGNGWAHLSDPHAAAGARQAQWDQTPAGVSCASAAAFRVGP